MDGSRTVRENDKKNETMRRETRNNEARSEKQKTESCSVNTIDKSCHCIAGAVPHCCNRALYRMKVETIAPGRQAAQAALT